MASAKSLILAVDDELNVLNLMKRILWAEGYEVITAADGDHALSLVSEKNPELVLLDIKMPGTSGLEVLKELRAHHGDIAVIMATGIGDVETAIEAMRMGAFDYLVKPFHTDEILISVERALERRRLVLENRDYQLNLEKKIAEQTQHLEQKIKELTALNDLVQSHLNQRVETEEAYRRLANSIAKMAEEMQALAKEAETQSRRLTTGDIMIYCHVSRTTALRWIKSGKLSAYLHPDGQYRITRAAFIDFLKAYKMPIHEELLSEADEDNGGTAAIKLKGHGIK